MKTPSDGRLCVVSLGGNALVRRGEAGTIEEQFDHVRSCTAGISGLIGEGWRVVITHGNGPIVGNIVIRNEAAKNTVPPMPLFICDADSEGGIGYMIQQTLYNTLRSIQRAGDVVTLVTQVIVDGSDPAFGAPTKPIGPFYTAEEAASLEKARGWTLREDSRRGYRRVVPSPRPLRIVEIDVVRRLAAQGVIVIAAGGGGVPVVELPSGDLRGVDAVVDKDLATSLLASKLGAERFINLTQIDRVYLDYGKDRQRGLADVKVSEIVEYERQGHFPAGSMGPKIRAAVEFLQSGGKEVIITSPELIEEAIKGKAGTRIRRG
ncbi:MAG: carbamate kinase [Nitrospiraceae bacterium]|nr:carbamate kinase [Nitrospiraceae bacterium]